VEALGQHVGLDAAMGLDHADDDVDAVEAAAPGLRQHLIGLADAGRGAEEDLELAAALYVRPLQQRIGRRSDVHHRDIILAPSSARLSFSTSTCGSPITPSSRPSTCASTRRRRSSAGMPRALATRGTWK